MTVLLVLVCSGFGAITRFGVDTLVQSRRLGEFPLGTLDKLLKNKLRDLADEHPEV